MASYWKLDRNLRQPLSQQLQGQLRQAIRDKALSQGQLLPSTRRLAEDLLVSRPVVVEAYAQLAAEGYLFLQQGRRARVSSVAAAVEIPTCGARRRRETPEEFKSTLPELTSFPRDTWLRAMKRGLRSMATADFGYSNPLGVARLREALADYVSRTRGAHIAPADLVITSGFAEARSLFCELLRATGRSTLALEDPGYSDRRFVAASGLTAVSVPVDQDGLDVKRLEASGAHGVIVTPSHQFPTGTILSATRRADLVEWLRGGDRLALEDDYDSEFRYDKAGIAPIQNVARERIFYAGTVSKTLAPALRLGWLAVPSPFRDDIVDCLLSRSEGVSRLDQFALATMIESGEYEHHVRRMRRVYGRRREYLIRRLGEVVPSVVVLGAAAGLHVVISLPPGVEPNAACAALRTVSIAAEPLSHYTFETGILSCVVVGFGQASLSGLDAAVAALQSLATAAKGITS